LVGNILSATIPGGTGFTVRVTAVAANARPVYNAGASIQPLWSSRDIDQVVYEAARDIGISMSDPEVENFANTSLKIES
jgi:hypothetical protein